MFKINFCLISTICIHTCFEYLCLAISFVVCLLLAVFNKSGVASIDKTTNRQHQKYGRTVSSMSSNNSNIKTKGDISENNSNNNEIKQNIQEKIQLDVIINNTQAVGPIHTNNRNINTQAQTQTIAIFPAMIVCPTSLTGNWKAELETWGYFNILELNNKTITNDEHSEIIFNNIRQGKIDIILCTYHSLIKYASTLATIQWSVVTFDEGHCLKNEK